MLLIFINEQQLKQSNSQFQISLCKNEKKK